MLLKWMLRTGFQSFQLIRPHLREVNHCMACQHQWKFIRSISTSSIQYKRKLSAQEKPEEEVTPKKKPTPVLIWKNMTVRDLAKTMEKSLDHVFEVMLYVPNTNNYDEPSSPIDDLQVIRDIVKKSGLRSVIGSPPTEKPKDEVKKVSKDIQSRPVSKKDLVSRPPVVTIMGHVDHGKTTLLDSLRDTHVAAGEAGGITQHIGAFQIQLEGRKVTFLDTPGHAAFYALRERGAQVTDIVVLVVAADDGVMEQTKESIRMFQEANVPVIVAINKIDRGDADIERTKSMLLQEGIQLEDFGGDVQAIPISALKKTHLNNLVEAILLQADIMNIQAENKGPMEGVVIESKMDLNRGKLSSALVQRGVLRKGAILVAGTAWAKVRGIFDDTGNPVSTAEPSTPVELIGWRQLPSAGDKIYEVESEKKAKEIVEYRESMKMKEKAEEDQIIIQEKVAEHLKEYKVLLEKKRKLGRAKLRREGPRPKESSDDPNAVRISVVVKGDVDGSVEAFLDVLDTYDAHEQCRLDVVHYGVGDVTESDVTLAETFGSHIYGFNVSISRALEEECKRQKIEFRLSNIIYRLVDALKKDIDAKLPTVEVEESLGEANVLAIFQVSEGKKKVTVAGCRCTKGTLKKSARFRVIRGEDSVIFDGDLTSMKHMKDEVDTVRKDVECGLGLGEMEVPPRNGDTILCYHMVAKAQKSDWNPGF